MKDRAMQALYLLALDPIAETLAEPNSYGFRLERSTADAIDQCHRVLSQRASAQWIFEGDIRACFDSLSHDWLVTHIPLDKAILRKWLQAGFMDKHLLLPTETGVPHKHGQSILYTSAEIIDCIAPWNGRVMGLVERCARMLTTSCVYEAYFLITTRCGFLRLFRALFPRSRALTEPTVFMR